MSSKDTLVNTNAIIEAINNSANDLRQEMNERFDQVDQRFNNIEVRLRFAEDKIVSIETRLTNIETRLTNIETDVSQIKEMQFVFENELDRLQAITHQSLNLAHENRADVRIMRREISAWSQDVRELQRQAA